MACENCKLLQKGSDVLPLRASLSATVTSRHVASLTTGCVFSRISNRSSFNRHNLLVRRASSGNSAETDARAKGQSDRHEDDLSGIASDISSDDEDTDDEEEDDEQEETRSPQLAYSLGGNAMISSEDEQIPIPDGVTAGGPLSSVVSAIRGVQQSKLVRMVTYWPAWLQKRKLQQLAAEANEQPSDPEKEAAYLTALIKTR